MKNAGIAVLLALLSSAPLFADAGVLIPRDKQQSDPSIL